MTDAADLARRRRQLLTRLRELDTRLQGIEAELLAHHDPDWEERAAQQEQDEALIALGEGGREEIRAIRAALERIAAGTYGICTRCGAEIAPARLDVLPATPFCAACAR
jgi:RNA polymerase-binding transcription factor DksA